MSDTKNFGLRIELLDEILGANRKYSFDNLLDRLNQRLHDSGFRTISEKTLYNDLKFLREEKGAPINKPTGSNPGYFYKEKFSIKDLPLTSEEVDYLKQAAEILKKAGPFQITSDIDQVIAKLENKIHTNVIDRGQIIQFESHTQASGERWLDSLFTAIKEKVTLRITYHPFHKKEAEETIFHPYLLKEYRNRWTLMGRLGDTNYVTNRPLDRIKAIRNSNSVFRENDLFDADTYFRNMVGYSVPIGGKIENIIIKIKSGTVPYILSKPIHRLQEVIKEYKNGDLKIKIPLYINFELKSLILSYGQGIVVLAPEILRSIINTELITTLGYYKM